MSEQETITVLANRLEAIKEQIKNLTIEQESLETVCVLFRQSLRRKYETLFNPSQLFQDYCDPSHREGVITYLKQYIKVFFPQSTSIEIESFSDCGEGPWYHICAIVDGNNIRLDVPSYENDYGLHANYYAYILSTDLSLQSAYDPTELIQYKENK